MALDQSHGGDESGRDLRRRSFIARGGAAAAAVAGAVAASTVVASPAAAQSFMPIFLPIGPFRAYDSRRDGRGRIGAGQTRRLVGGVDPEDYAHLYNLTVTNTAAAGYLAIFPGDEPYNGTSSINWFGPNQMLANNVYTTFDLDDGGINVRCGGGSTHFVIDLVGALMLVDLGAARSERVGAAFALDDRTERSARRTAAD